MPDNVHAAALVESPLQLLAAIEAHAAGLGGHRTRVLTREEVPGLRAAQADLEAAGLPAGLSVHAGSVRPPWHGHEPVQLVGDAFSGLYQSGLATGRLPDRTVLLDDGLATLELARLLAGRRALIRLGRRAPLYRRALGARTAQRLLRLARRREDGVTLFTALPLPPDLRFRLAERGVRLRDCDFSWLRSTPLPPAPVEETIVLGSALAADGWIREAAYHAWVEGLAGEGTVRYFPHRRERPAALARIAALPGVEVAPPGGPVELRLRGLSGQRLVSLPSTASVLLARLLAGRAVEVRPQDVPEEWWTPAARAELRAHLRLVLELTETARKEAA